MPSAMRTNATRHQVFLRSLSVKANQIPSPDVVSIPVGAAGSVVNFNLSYHPIANSGGTDIGSEGDTTIAISSGDVFTTQVGYKADSDLANGEYYVDHLNGKARGKKATTNTTMTFTYNIFQQVQSTADVGPGAPKIDSYNSIAINKAAGANQNLVSAPGANKQIWIYSYHFAVNAAGTVALEDEDDTPITGIMPLTEGIVVPSSGNFSMPKHKLATNKALEIDIVTSEVDGSLEYAIVSV